MIFRLAMNLSKAALREINFGENDMMGEKVSVAGVDEIRKGFKVCRYCGTIQSSDGRSRKHSFFCKTNKNPQLLADGYETCLFLYREFETEILRMLILQLPRTPQQHEQNPLLQPLCLV